jgi:hypothetical protein
VKIKENKNTYIICLEDDKSQLRVFGENGILRRLFKYDKISEECGSPVCVSDNGLIMIFEKSSVSKEIYVIKLSVEYGLTVKKRINVKEAVEKCV